jgi:glycosyltransferase involved in cell wall biosynthesis
MGRSTPHVHCELGPVLVNRTAVYKICKAVPSELQRRGFRVSCSALLGRLAADTAEPATAWERRLFHLSQRWLCWSVARPQVFRRVYRAGGWLPRWRHGGLYLFLDALYLLFYGAPDTGVVVIYDVSPATEPGWHSAGASLLYAAAFARLARSRCQIVTSCRMTADELRLNWGIAPSRLTVLPLAGFSSPGLGEGTVRQARAPFFLFVGSFEQRKNVAGLIRAYAASGLYAARGIRLRLVGLTLGETNPTVGLARSTPGVDVEGYIDDRALATAYARCLAFVYPSLCEGFGLPLLEAMSHGCVCLSSTATACPEVAGDAALYCNPHDCADMARGLRQVAALTPTERRQWAGQARARAGLFTWTRFYDGLAGVLRRATEAA